MPMMSTEKREALRKAMQNHAFQTGQAIGDLAAAREALSRAGAQFHPQLEKFNRGLKTLSRMKELTEEFVDNLK